MIPSAAGAITIEADALAGLVIAAVERVDGARVRRPRRGLDVSIEGDAVRVALELAVRYGSVLPELARAVQASVATALRDAASLTVAAVDVTVEELDP
ncbi:MAG: Asp23/Gls24 family envelope stress response protein [Gaiellaceae bacterium]